MIAVIAVITVIMMVIKKTVMICLLMQFISQGTAANDWLPVTRGVHIDFNPQTEVLHIKTDSVEGRGEQVLVIFYDNQGVYAGNINIEFSSTLKYYLAWCTKRWSTMDNVPSEQDKTWTIYRTSEKVKIECNGVTVLDFSLSSCTYNKWSTYWDRDVATIQFHIMDKASDYFRATEECKAGTYQDSTKTKCSPCEQNTVSQNNKATSCVACTPGTVSNSQLTQCVNCAAGTYRTTDKVTCESCPDDNSISTAGASTCTTCDAGTVSNHEKTVCEECKAGTYHDSTKTKCSPCEQNTVSQNNKATSCVACTPGTVSNTQLTQCVNCAAGTYRSTDKVTCESCLDNSMSTAGAGSCIPCDVGTVSNTEKTSCDPCSEDKYRDSSMPECLVCPEDKTMPNSHNSKCGLKAGRTVDHA